MTDRMTRARALYLAVYESQGGQWEANDCKNLWCDKADRYLELCGGVAQATREPSTMTERLIQAAVDYEQAGGQHAAAARRELSDARAAIEAALSPVSSTERTADVGDLYAAASGHPQHRAAAITSTHQRETYCALCDLEHQLHEDAQGFHHVIYGGRVACPVPSTHQGGGK